MKNETVNTLQNKGLESPTALNVNLDNDIITAEKDKNKKDLKSFVCMEIVNTIKFVIQYTTLICSSHDLTWQTVIRLSLKLTRLSEMSDSVVSR